MVEMLEGHEWIARVSNRNNGSGCPNCAGKKVNNENCLQTVNPTLAKEWHFIKNNKILASHVTVKSRKIVWWTCSKKHECKARVADRSKGSGCPICYRLKLKGF